MTAIASVEGIEGQRAHFRAKPELASGRRTLSVHVDLGTGQLDALAEIVRAVDVSAAGKAVRACRIGPSSS